MKRYVDRDDRNNKVFIYPKTEKYCIIMQQYNDKRNTTNSWNGFLFSKRDNELMIKAIGFRNGNRCIVNRKTSFDKQITDTFLLRG